MLSARLSSVQVVLVALFTVSWICAAPTSSTGQQRETVCDPSIRPFPFHSLTHLSYKSRGDRCEGDYQAEVNSELHLSSVTMGQPALDPAQDYVALTWSARAREVRVRVLSTRRVASYRMDVAPAPPLSSFLWQLDVLKQRLADKSRELVPSDFGFVATGLVPETGDASRIHLPLRVGAHLNASSLRIVLWTSGEVDEIYTTVDDIAFRTRKLTNLWRDRREPGTTHRPYQPFHVDLELPSSEPGVHRVEIAVVGTGITSRTFRVLHD